MHPPISGTRYTLLDADHRAYPVQPPRPLRRPPQDQDLRTPRLPRGAPRDRRRRLPPRSGVLADERTAVAAGYRSCAACLPETYRAWKASRSSRDQRRHRGDVVTYPRRGAGRRACRDRASWPAHRSRTGAGHAARRRHRSTHGSDRARAPPHIDRRRSRVRDRLVGPTRLVVGIIDWPASAASSLRPARRRAAVNPDAWVIADTPAGWVQVTRRLVAEPAWHPSRTIGFASLARPELIDLTGATTLIGMLGATTTGTSWRIGHGVLIHDGSSPWL